MVDIGVYNFVKNAVAAGKSKEDIVADLTRGGRLSSEMIEEAFAAVESGQVPAAPAATAVPLQTGGVSFQEKTVSAADVGLTIPASTVGHASPTSAMNNTSGQGAASVVPPEILHWNWGAFGFSWLWGIFNGTWIALLALIPLVNIVMIFVLGAKGNEWAWRNKHWESVLHFRQVQRQWSIAFLICLLLFFILPLGLIAYFGPQLLQSPQFQAALQQARTQVGVNQQQSGDVFHQESGQ